MSQKTIENKQNVKNNEGICKKCKKPAVSATVKCSICNSIYHKSCSRAKGFKFTNYDEDEINCDCTASMDSPREINLTDLIFTLKSIEHKIDLMRIDMNLLKSENNELKEIISELKNARENSGNEIVQSDKTETKTSYANILKKNNNDIILVKPADDAQASDMTHNEITKAIDPGKMGIRIEKVKNISKGGIIINCADSESKGKLIDKVQEEFGNRYKIETPKAKYPRIIIKNAELQFIDKPDNDIISNLLEQNDINLETTDKMKLIKKYKNTRRTNSGNIIIETHPEVFDKIINLQKLNVGWRECQIEEYFNVLRCFTCGDYNHLARNCNGEAACLNCAQNHKTVECNSDAFKCINCVKAINKLKIRIDCNHSALDKECPCYKRVVERNASKISYHL